MMRNFVKRNKIFDNNFAFCEQDQRKKKGELVFFFYERNVKNYLLKQTQSRLV